MNNSINLENVARAICTDQGFVFVEKTGKGAFKETFHIKDGNSSFALKVYDPGRRNEREQREVDAMRRCSHSHIARLVALETFSYRGEDYLYLTEEFIAGGTLSQFSVLRNTG